LFAALLYALPYVADIQGFIGDSLHRATLILHRPGIGLVSVLDRDSDPREAVRGLDQGDVRKSFMTIDLIYGYRRECDPRAAAYGDLYLAHLIAESTDTTGAAGSDRPSGPQRHLILAH